MPANTPRQHGTGALIPCTEEDPIRRFAGTASQLQGPRPAVILDD